MNDENLKKFKELLQNETWDEVHNANGTQLKCNKFAEIYSKHYDSNTAFPKKTVRRKNERKLSKPWIFPWLEDACARLDKLDMDFV